MKRLVLFVACIAASLGPAWAAPFTARVVHVGDGDTVYVRDAAGRVAVRIDGIDAPEICQASGTAARDALAALVLRREVRVTPRARDAYGRVVAGLAVGREDVAAALVRHGHAWAAVWHGRSRYRRLETQARRERRGLWREARPEPPRAFRHRHGSCR